MRWQVLLQYESRQWPLSVVEAGSATEALALAKGQRDACSLVVTPAGQERPDLEARNRYVFRRGGLRLSIETDREARRRK